MARPVKQQRRASLLGFGRPILSLFAPSDAPVEKKRNRRASISNCTSTSVSPVPQQFQPSDNPSSKAPPSSAPSPQPLKQERSVANCASPFVMEEVEISGMELLRCESMDTDESFSYESYAHDSFALAREGGVIHHGGIRSGMAHRSPSECRPRRRMSNCSSIGADSLDEVGSQICLSLYQPQSCQLNYCPTSNLRSSFGASTVGSEYIYYYGQPQPDPMRNRYQRRASMGHYPKQASRKTFSRRGSTGTSDLPGFGAYKARRRASYNGANTSNFTPGEFVLTALAGSVNFDDSSHRTDSLGRTGQMDRYGRLGSMESFGIQEESGDKAAYFGLSETRHTYQRRGSLGSYGGRGGDNLSHSSAHESYRRNSIGSDTGGGRPRT